MGGLFKLNFNKLFSRAEPTHTTTTQIAKFAYEYRAITYKPYTFLHHRETAIQRLYPTQRVILVELLLLLFLSLLISVTTTAIIIMAVITAFYFIDLIFKFNLVVLSLHYDPEEKVLPREFIAREKWPRYSIICPLYHEAVMVNHFIRAIDHLEYPKDKLQVLLVLEEDDAKTIHEIQKLSLPASFQVLVVPDGLPKTKPKACNFALHHAKGRYIVIYDAEDIPEKDQLKKAVTAFEREENSKVICLQAKLNYYNAKQNILTRLFTLEYSQWFDLILPGLHKLGAPIPLGGTSNHFRRSDLLYLQGWDPFNVTEDCDLGIRLYKKGFKTKILNSVTWEEAMSNLPGWLRQRSRWIKGYIQTYLVHSRPSKDTYKKFSRWHLLVFNFIVGGTPFSILVNPIMWSMTLLYFLSRNGIGRYISAIFPIYVYYFAIAAFVFGNFLYVLYYLIGVGKRDDWYLAKWFIFIPLYWFLMSVAAWIALYQFLMRPFHWEKTKHGLHLADRNMQAYRYLLS